MMRRDVVVVGGGVVGLAAAWRLAQHGRDTVVVDPAPGRGATQVAAGMLAPVTEVHYGEVPLLALNLESARRWPSFAAEVEAAAGFPIGYRREGTVTVALTDDDHQALAALVEFQERLHLPIERLSRAACRTLEPSLSPRVRSGAYAPDDHQVEPRALTAALLVACEQAGVELDRRAVASLEPGPAVRLDDGDTLAGATVLVAAGVGSAGLAALPVRPVKGQILRLAGNVAALLTRTVRGLWRGKSVYLVPRAEDELVVGATVEERGFDMTVTAGAVHELLDTAIALVPGVTDLELCETRAGLRPGTPDNAPIIGVVPNAPGVVVATGHYRNGILLAPVTADVIAGVVTGAGTPGVAAAFGLERFR